MKNKYPTQLFVFGIALIFLCNINAFSKEYFVSQSLVNGNITQQESTQSSIQKAINAAFDGDTIRVGKGIYDEDLLYINKSIVLLGCQVGNSPLSSIHRDGGECVILNSLNPFNSIVINAPNVVIDGFTFGNNTDKAFNGIYINAEHVIVRNCIIINASSCGVYISANAQGAEVAYNHVKKSSFEGIFNVADAAQILSNFISDIQEFSAITTTRKAIIKGNIISNVAENGISLLQPEAILSLVYGNEISNTGKDKIFYCIDTNQVDPQVENDNTMYVCFNLKPFSKPKIQQSEIIQNPTSNSINMIVEMKLTNNNELNSFNSKIDSGQNNQANLSLFKF